MMEKLLTQVDTIWRMSISTSHIRMESERYRDPYGRDAVKSMTVAFLEMWNAAGNVKSKELVPRNMCSTMHTRHNNSVVMSSHMQTVLWMESR